MARQMPNTSVQVVFPGTDTALPLDALKAAIAMELAAGLSDAEGIKKTYGISESQWAILKRTPLFRSMLKEAIERHERMRGEMEERRAKALANSGDGQRG